MLDIIRDLLFDHRPMAKYRGWSTYLRQLQGWEHLITDKEKILERWGEHFDNVLIRPLSVNKEAINRLPQFNMNPSVQTRWGEPSYCKSVKWQDPMLGWNTPKDIRSWQSNSCFTMQCGRMMNSLRSIKTPSLPTCTKACIAGRSVIITGVFLS